MRPYNSIEINNHLPVDNIYSRDGFHYSRRKDRTAFLKPNEKEGVWDCGYLHCCSSICTIREDELIFIIQQ